MTSISGFRALAARQVPAAPLPPPTGTRITSVSGAASRISTAMVPAPEISSGSLAECTYRRPSRRATSSTSTRASSKSRPWRRTSAPSRSMASSLAGLAPSAGA